MLEEAHQAARDVIASDAPLGRPEHEALRRTLWRDYREPLELVMAG